MLTWSFKFKLMRGKQQAYKRKYGISPLPALVLHSLTTTMGSIHFLRSYSSFSTIISGCVRYMSSFITAKLYSYWLSPLLMLIFHS